MKIATIEAISAPASNSKHLIPSSQTGVLSCTFAMSTQARALAALSVFFVLRRQRMLKEVQGMCISLLAASITTGKLVWEPHLHDGCTVGGAGIQLTEAPIANLACAGHGRHCLLCFCKGGQLMTP